MTIPKITRILTALIGVLVVPVAAYAQASIAGTVRDTSGGVLPGVTVEAASPALIEQVRTAVTDGTGQYRVENLRPGVYSVTFTLPGFSTVVREGVELMGDFTFTVNVEMDVGGLEETITVTGETPVVDTQSVERQSVVTRDVVTALPTSGGYSQIMLLAPGIVGGSPDIDVGACGCTFSAYGAAAAGRSNYDGRTMLDGLLISVPQGSSTNAFTDTRNAQEVTLTTSGGLGESDTSGPVLNIVPRTGSNVFSGSVFADWMNKSLQGNNLNDRLRSLGVSAATPLTKNYDMSGSLGGPIAQDRLWFFGVTRKQGYRQDVDQYFNKNAGDATKWNFEPDFSRQVFTEETYQNYALRLTAQVTPRNKVNIYWDEQARCKGCENYYQALKSPEAGRMGEQWPIQTQQITWSSPVSNRVLADFAFGSYRADWGGRSKQNPYTGDLVRMIEQCTRGCPDNGNIAGLTYRSQSNDLFDSGTNQNRVFSWRATLSFVTGSLNFKAGYTGNRLQDKRRANNAPNNLTYRVDNLVPNRLTMYINDFPNTTFMRTDGFFAQESWTRDRLTLQGAVRLDVGRSWAPAQEVGPARFMPEVLAVPKTPMVDSYKDISPRVAVAYDVFGDGKTALKASWGRYVESARTGGPFSVANPMNAIPSNVNRSWIDADSDFVPDCDLLNPAAQDLRGSGGDYCGAFSNRSFGTSNPTRTVDPAVLGGWGVRPFDRMLQFSVQHEVLPRTSVEVGFVRRTFRNFMVTDNLATTAADYDTFSITAPDDPRLPGGGGYTISGLYDVNPALFGQTDEFVTWSSTYGNQYAVYNGVDINFTARPRSNLTIQGGSNWGRTTVDSCEVRAAVPESALVDPYCHAVTGYLPHLKLHGAYIVPRLDVQVGATYVARPGLRVSRFGTPSGGGYLRANYRVSNTEIAQSLGRNLAGGRSNVTVDLTEPHTTYGDTLNEFNVRISKIVRIGSTRAAIGVDIYNVLNVAPALNYNEAFIPGGAWLTPTSIMKARFAKINVQFDF